MYRNRGTSVERCTAVLFGSVMVMCVFACDSANDFEEYEKFMGEMTKILHDGRLQGAKRRF